MPIKDDSAMQLMDSAWFCDVDGNRLAPVSGVQDADITCDTTLPPGGMAIDYADISGKTYTFELIWRNWMTPRLIRQIYRWKARGPVRQRLLRKLLIQESRGYLKRGY